MIPSMQLLRGRSNQITVSLDRQRNSPAPLLVKLSSTTHCGWRATSATRCPNSALSEATQPGFQYSASSETKGRPVISDSRLANVDLPDPDDPMTRTRCIGSIRG